MSKMFGHYATACMGRRVVTLDNYLIAASGRVDQECKFNIQQMSYTSSCLKIYQNMLKMYKARKNVEDKLITVP